LYTPSLTTVQAGSAFLGVAPALISFSLALRRRASIDADTVDLLPADELGGRRALVRRGLGVVVTLALLAGLITGPLDVALLGGAVVIGLLMPAFAARVPRVARLLVRVPVVIRFLLGLGITFAVSELISLNFYQPAFGSEFFPLVVSLAVGIVVFHLLMVAGPASCGPQKPSMRP